MRRAGTPSGAAKNSRVPFPYLQDDAQERSDLAEESLVLPREAWMWVMGLWP
jgi:hypothetical protein